jgi:hypothetical protein
LNRLPCKLEQEAPLGFTDPTLCRVEVHPNQDGIVTP